MEFVGQSGSSGASSLLGVPGLSTLDLDVNDDDGEFVIGIRPKSSPQPRRRSSVCDEDSEPEPSPCGSRRVSFADAKGQSLVQVKEFDSWDVPKLPGYDCSESSGTDQDDYFLCPLNFCLPSSAEELSNKIQEQKVHLETIELVPGTTILKGVIRVLNICFSKAVYIRTTLDTWSSHFDLLAEHIPGSSDNLTDCFSFKLTLVPPFGEQGARVDFCLRYETPAGTFWANNNSKNYVLLCQKRVRRSLDKPQWENANKKSCLKTAGQTFSAVEIVSADDSGKENTSRDVLRLEEKKAAVKTKKVSEDEPGATDEKETTQQKLLGEDQHNRIQRTQRQTARMARVRRLFFQRDGGANELQRDELQREETPSEVFERSSKSQASLKTCNVPALVVYDVSQAHETCNTEPEKSKSFDVARGGEGDAVISDNPSPTNDYDYLAECQNDTGAKPADRIIPALGSENGFRFGTVVAPLYQQVFCAVGSERPTVRDWVNPSQATTNLIQMFPLTDGKKTPGTEPADDGDNKDKILVTKTEDSRQGCSLKSLKSSTNKEGEKGAMVEESPVVQNVESLKVPEILSDQNSNTLDILKTVLGEKVVHSQTPNSLNPNFAAPELFTEGLNLWGETQERDVTNDLRGQSTAGTAQDPWPEHPCQVKTSTCKTQGQREVQSLEISLQTSERAPPCLDRDNGSGGHKSLTFHGKAQEEKAEMMWVCRPMHGDTLVKQDGDTGNCEETNANIENIVSTDEELSFTIGDTEVSDEDRREQMEDSETAMVSENIDTTEMEMETTDNKLLEMITAADEKGKMTQDTLQGIQEMGAEEGSLESLSTPQEEKNTAEPAIKTKDEQEEMGSENENHTAETFQVNIERKNILDQDEEAVIEEEIMILWRNGDDHKAQEMDENVQEKNPVDRGEVLVDLTSEPESTAVNEQENDASLNMTDNKGENCSYAPENDVQHKQECDKENTGEEQSANMANETLLDKEEAFHNNTNVTHDLSKAEGDEPEHAAAEEWPCQWPEGDRLSPDDTSSESDSGDEVELYMHCLRAVHRGAQVQKDKNRDAGSNAVKSLNRGKLLSTPMPSISESADEEPPLGWHQDSGEETAEIQTKPAALPETSEQIIVSTNVAKWDTLKCENVSKTLLYATMLVSFVFLAFYYDFLACFGLYILSIIWLCCQSDRQPVKHNRLG